MELIDHSECRYVNHLLVGIVSCMTTVSGRNALELFEKLDFEDMFEHVH